MPRRRRRRRRHTAESTFLQFRRALARLPGKKSLTHMSQEKRLVGELISSGFYCSNQSWPLTPSGSQENEAD